MARSTIYSSALLLVFVALGSTLEVAPDSKCASLCLDDPKKGNATMREASATNSTMLACYDADFVGAKSTAVGRKFAECNTCLQSSGYADTVWDERDITWFKLNNRAAVDWCVFGTFENEDPNPNVNTTAVYQACNSKCSAISSSINYKLSSDSTSYDYCDYQGNFLNDTEDCINCLYDADNLTILGNILTTVRELCVNHPTKNFTWDYDIYKITRIAQVVDPSSNPISQSTALPSASSSAPSPPSSSSSSGLSKGALAGIVLGALLVIVAILCGVLLILRREKNKRKPAVAKSKEGATYELGNGNASGGYHELPAAGGNAYGDTASHGETTKYGHTAQLAELHDQAVLAELGSTSPTTTPYRDTHELPERNPRV